MRTLEWASMREVISRRIRASMRNDKYLDYVHWVCAATDFDGNVPYAETPANLVDVIVCHHAVT